MQDIFKCFTEAHVLLASKNCLYFFLSNCLITTITINTQTFIVVLPVYLPSVLNSLDHKTCTHTVQAHLPPPSAGDQQVMYRYTSCQFSAKIMKYSWSITKQNKRFEKTHLTFRKLPLQMVILVVTAFLMRLCYVTETTFCWQKGLPFSETGTTALPRHFLLLTHFIFKKPGKKCTSYVEIMQTTQWKCRLQQNQVGSCHLFGLVKAVVESLSALSISLLCTRSLSRPFLTVT